MADGSGLTFMLDKLDQVVTDLGFPPVQRHRTLGSKLNMFVYTLVADDRYCGSAARYHPLLHRASV